MESNAPPAAVPDKPSLGIAIVGSNTIAVTAELVAATQGYQDFVAVRRRGNGTTLPVLMDCDAWNESLRRLGYIHARNRIRAADNTITELVGGRRFDCFIHTSKDLFCQLLATHPLCNRYHYLEEGLTSLLGGRFGKPRKRKLQPFIWKWRSRVFYQNRLNIFNRHFDTNSPKYGGSFALSKDAFKDFPGRVQLSLSDLPAGEAVNEDIVIFLDAQYVGKPIESEYTRALLDCLRGLIDKPSSVAVKFHPRETDPERKERFLSAIRDLESVTGIVELPPSFVGERMVADRPIKAVVGTSAIGIYLGGMSFPTYTFAHRLEPLRELVGSMPPRFHEVCKPA